MVLLVQEIKLVKCLEHEEIDIYTQPNNMGNNFPDMYILCNCNLLRSLF